MASDPPADSSSSGQPRQLGRYVLLSGAVIVFAVCLVLSFNRAAQQHDAALRDAGANLRVAFLAHDEMQQLRHGFDVFARGGDGVDRDTLRTGQQRLLGARRRPTRCRA